MTEAVVSHGRGGTGNIGPDDTKYVDGGIHRESDPASAGLPYSTGRGGASNIASPKSEPVKTGSDGDIVPEAAKVLSRDGPYHGGRGGEGNVVEPEQPKKKGKGLADRIKEKLASLLKRKKTAKGTTATTEAPNDTEAAPTTSEPTAVEPAAEATPAPAEVKA